MSDNHLPRSDISPAERFYEAAYRPARLIKVICQMIIGIGVAVALILKVYMLVLTDLSCAADTASLGNQIRCTGTLELAAYALALAAGFELAFLMFVDGLDKAATPLALGLSSAFLLVLADLSLASATWQTALLILALTVSSVVLLGLRRFLWRRPTLFGRSDKDHVS